MSETVNRIHVDGIQSIRYKKHAQKTIVPAPFGINALPTA
jgi:hypothetical protein